MFNFGRKKEDKDKKRREKKDRHKKFLDGGSVMTQDELNRLSELSRKQSGSPEKLPSGITADYRLLDKDNPDSSSLKMPKKEKASSDKHDSLTRSRPTSLDTPPPLPERPPPKMKKSILKSSQSYDVSRSVSSELDDPHILLKNTKANEMFAYRKSLQQAAAAKASPVRMIILIMYIFLNLGTYFALGFFAWKGKAQIDTFLKLFTGCLNKSNRFFFLYKILMVSKFIWWEWVHNFMCFIISRIYSPSYKTCNEIGPKFNFFLIFP